jgi:hypothetical protein
LRRGLPIVVGVNVHATDKAIVDMAGTLDEATRWSQMGEWEEKRGGREEPETKPGKGAGRLGDNSHAGYCGFQIKSFIPLAWVIYSKKSKNFFLKKGGTSGVLNAVLERSTDLCLSLQNTPIVNKSNTHKMAI